MKPTADAERPLHEIQAEMQETRAALADKLETLHERVVGTVETAQATVEQIGETVQETMHAARRTLDLKYHTERRPWTMVGLSVLTGAVAGYLATRPSCAVRAAGPAEAFQYSTLTAHESSSCPVPESPPQMFHQSPDRFAEEWDRVRSVAVGVGMALAREWLKDAAPGFADPIEQVMNSATVKLGGVAIEGRLIGMAAVETENGNHL
jgi:ElaB/YqjD/DUF883 family membrane-anchored ribosome-binding protein